MAGLSLGVFLRLRPRPPLFLGGRRWPHHWAPLLVVVLMTSFAGRAQAISPETQVLLAGIETSYDVVVIHAPREFPVPVNGGAIDGRAAADEEIDSYAPLLAQELSLYPPCLVRMARLERIVLCKQLSFAGQRRGAVPDMEHDTLYLDVCSASHNRQFVRKVLHHDFFHLLDFRDDGRLLEDSDWSRLNPPEFRYGKGGETAQDNPQTSLASDDHPGFLNHYSTTGVAEDKAELFAHLLVEHERVVRRAGKDAVLNAKVHRMKALLADLCPEIDCGYWRAAAKRRPE